jgi:hypothetical protein
VDGSWRSPAGGFRYLAIAVQLVEPGVRIGPQDTTEPGKMGLRRVDAFFCPGCKRTTPPARLLIQRQSSRTYVHNRSVFASYCPQQH